jgi:6-pyruvoyltetrahydropterin/6-carboxytetrahydropterin synthase
MKIEVTKELKFCCAHRLLNYRGACANVHGHNYKVLVTFTSDGLDSLGMVIDFGVIKKHLQQSLDDEYDHSIVLNKKDPLVNYFKSANLKMNVMLSNPTAEAMASRIIVMARDLFEEENITVTRVRVYETDTSYAEVIA